MLLNFLKLLTIPRMVFCIFFAILTTFIALQDPDYFWHLKTGEYIVTHRLLPRQDIFSFTMAGHPWVLHEWLFQVLIYIIHALNGALGVKLFSITLLLAAIFLTYRISEKLSSTKIAGIIVLVFASILMGAGLSPRPHLFSYLFFSYYLYGLISWKYFNNFRHLYLCPLLMIFWVNLHGGYIVGIGLLFLFSATELVTHLLAKNLTGKQFKNIFLLLVIAFLSLGASALNPDFLDHWKYPLKVLSMDAAKNFISEWQSPNFHNSLGKLYLLFVFSFLFANIYSDKRPDLTELIIPSFFIAEGFISVRHIPLAVMATVPFFSLAIKHRAHFLQNFSLNLPLFRGHLGKIRAASKRDIGEKEYVFNWLLLLATIGIIIVSYPTIMLTAEKSINKNLPVDAVNFIIDKKIEGRIFNNYDFGGYLIYRLYPEQMVFVDGRADMYGDDFLKKYSTIAQGLPEWRKEFDKYKIDYVLCRRKDTIRQLLLTQDDFTLVYDDEYNSVLLKDIPRFSHLTTEFKHNNP